MLRRMIWSAEKKGNEMHKKGSSIVWARQPEIDVRLTVY
jgi:hypothetical protein